MVWALPTRRISRALPALLVAFSCGRDPDPIEETFPEPRPAQPTLVSQVAKYEVHSQSRARFRLKGRDGKVEGSVPMAGTVVLDLLNLKHSKGRLTSDLFALEIVSPDVELAGTAATQAQQWLGLGDRVPENLRARFRGASFELTRVLEANAESAHEGRRPKRKKKRSRTAEVSLANPSVIREVRLKLQGDLELHGYRADYTAHLVAAFHFADEPVAGSIPERIVIRSRKTMTVPLEAHNIAPRDAHGAPLAPDQLRDLGRGVHIEVELVLEHRPN